MSFTTPETISPTGAFNLAYADFAQYISSTLFAAQTGTIPAIPNPLASSQADTSILTSPERIRAYRESLADQLNAASQGPRFEDLSERIAGIEIITTAQGASTLEVSLIDPLWVIPRSGFIRADATGYLLPVDVRFPSDTNMHWRLCQYRPSWSADAAAPNLVLTFEDRIVSLLREVSAGNGGIAQGQPNQTLIEFFAQLVSSANQLLRPVPPIHLVPLIANTDPNAIVQVTQLPSRSQLKIRPSGLTAQLQNLLAHWQQMQLGAFPSAGQLGSISETEKTLAQRWAEFQRNPITAPIP